jgi:zinc protease
MKKQSILFAFALLLFALAHAPVHGWAQHTKKRPIDQLSYPPLRFLPRRPEKVQLANGMTLLILEDHRTPLINMFAMIRSGNMYDPADKIGLADTMAATMRSGGTTSMTADEVDAKLEFVAASVETWMTEKAGYASMSALTKDIGTILPIFADLLMNPAFNNERLEVTRNQRLNSIRRQNDTPLAISGRIFPQLIYGKSSPLARSATEESVKRITREDVVRFHDTYYHPNNVVLGISGDVTKDAIIQTIEHIFAGWQPQKTAFGKLPVIQATVKQEVYFIHRDIGQTTFRIGNLGIEQTDPDYLALTLANSILGGGFFSRLFNELRTKEGLAYLTLADHAEGLGAPGYFYTHSETRAGATLRAIEIVQHLIKQMREMPVSDSELNATKESILNSFVFDYDSPKKITENAVTLYYFGLPLDFLQKYRDNITKVTKEDILNAAKKHYRPEATILVIGNEKEFDGPLSTLGDVTVIDLDRWR